MQGNYSQACWEWELDQGWNRGCCDGGVIICRVMEGGAPGSMKAGGK